MFQKIFHPRENCVEVTTLLVESLNASVTHTTIEKQLTSHPNYPSAVSISDLLTSLQVGNISFTVTIDFLDNVTDPFLTLIESDQYHIDMYTMVKPLGGDQVCFFDPDQHIWKTVDKKTFIPKWRRNFVMLFEAEEAVIEEDYKQHLFSERRNNLYKYLTYFSLPVIALMAIVLNLFLSGTQALHSGIYMLLTLAGCFVGALLLSYDIDKHNPLLKNICGKGKKVNCGAILSSKGAKIAGISWSSIGFTYFAGQLLLGLFNIFTQQPALTTVLFLTNAVALPYIIYSITFQYRAKQWCTLCLTVQGLLALQFIVNITSGINFMSHWDELWQPQFIALVALAFALPAITLAMLMPNLIAAKEGKFSKNELNRLKHNPQVFDILLKQQKQLTLAADNLGVKIGGGSNKIIKVCNPYCIPCSDAHKTIEEVLHTNPDVELQIIYWISPSERASNVVKHFIAIERMYGGDRLKEALDYWYLTGTKDYEDFAGKFPVDAALLELDQELVSMFSWCLEEEITFTPTFFVNGFQMPGTYDVKDLKYLLAN